VPAAVASSCCAAGYLGLLLSPGVSLLWVLIAGCGSGPTLVLALSFIALRVREPRQAAALSAMAQSAGYLIAAAGPFIFGALHSASGSWSLSLIVLLASAVALFGVSFGAGSGVAAV
jgi:MFS transporter, CP family, cyanate transporter